MKLSLHAICVVIYKIYINNKKYAPTKIISYKHIISVLKVSIECQHTINQ